MGSIAIKLVPDRLHNPDLDLRYIIPDRISELTGGRVEDNGYDYIDDGGGEGNDSMVIFMRSENPAEDVRLVLDALRRETFLDNDIHEAAVVATCEEDGRDFADHVIVHPR